VPPDVRHPLDCGPSRIRYVAVNVPGVSISTGGFTSSFPTALRKSSLIVIQRSCCPSRATSEISKPGNSCHSVQRTVFITPILLDGGRKGAALGNPGVMEMAGYPVSRGRSHSGPDCYVLDQSRDHVAEMTGIGHGPSLVVSSSLVQMLRGLELMRPDKESMAKAIPNSFFCRTANIALFLQRDIFPSTRASYPRRPRPTQVVKQPRMRIA